ncbi:hypothetical protein O185_16000 [Photorhabdus temperata J3]|uniref:Uncharacterized protein n=1 Tax=Photorhabdus temperata J3 TaxID=1389415 RepID=U7QZX5_PHOTE|nr:hypothetical protein O185_16000 [Photorhabdus temperata J3]
MHDLPSYLLLLGFMKDNCNDQAGQKPALGLFNGYF